MATYSVSKAKHSTLVATTIDSVTVGSAGVIRIDNRSGTAEIYFTAGPASSPPPDPTVGGDNTMVVPAGIVYYSHPVTPGSWIVKLISSGTPTYSVTGTAS